MVKLSSTLFLVSASFFLQTHAQAFTEITFTDASQASRAISRLSTYVTHLTAQPQYTSVQSVLETAMPDSVVSSIESVQTSVLYGGIGGGNPGNIDGITTQSWYTAMPSDVKNYLSSVTNEEIKLVTGGARELRVPGALAVAAVGVMGLLGGMVLL